MASVPAVLRSWKSAKTHRHTLFADSSRRWLSNEQQSKSPQSFVQFGPFGYKSQARGEDIEFSVLTGTDSESSVPDKPCGFATENGTRLFSHKSFPIW